MLKMKDCNGNVLKIGNFIYWTHCPANCHGHQDDVEVEGVIVGFNKTAVRVVVTSPLERFEHAYLSKVPRTELNNFCEVVT